MGWVSTIKEYKVGDRVKTTKVHSSMIGKMTKGTWVTITGTSPRGYAIMDDEGHSLCEIGWTI